MSLGKALGEGQTLDQIMAERNSVAEGVHTAEIVYKIASENNLDMPITEAVYQILKGKQDMQTVIAALLARPFTTESE